MGSDIEVLAIGNCLLRKEDQNPALKQDYTEVFELD
jgi:carbamoyltransferase